MVDDSDDDTERKRLPILVLTTKNQKADRCIMKHACMYMEDKKGKKMA
jgi:hypothetical protein